MTQSEKNTKHSEIYAAKSTDLSTISLLDSSNFKYCMLAGNQPLAIIAPNAGYWNMILLQGSKPCELEMGNGIIEIIMGQPIFREARQGESLRIVSQNPFHKVLLIFIPKNEIPQEIQLSSLLTQNERGGHKLEDSRILLKITRIQELSQHNDYINQLKLHTSLAELFIYQLEKIRVLDTTNISEIK
ncbi:MAG: hypothetical protein ACRDE7_04000, partial [Sphingobacterium sp.]